MLQNLGIMFIELLSKYYNINKPAHYVRQLL